MKKSELDEFKKQVLSDKVEKVETVVPLPPKPAAKRGVIVRAAPVAVDGRNYKIVAINEDGFLIPSEDLHGSRGTEVDVLIDSNVIKCYNFSDEIRSLSIPPDTADKLRKTFWQSGGATKDDLMREDIQSFLKHILPPTV